jgi:hypothetical protein
MVMASERSGVTDSVHNAAFLAEVRQGDNDAVDLFSVLFEELGATLGLGVGFHRAMPRLLGAQDNSLCSRGFEDGDHLIAARFGQMAGEEPAVAYYDSKSHRSL